MCAANSRASSVCAMFDFGVVAASSGVLADWIAAPKRFGHCETWDEPFLGMATDATCAVVVVVSMENKDFPDVADTGALEDCAFGPTELKDCETWEELFLGLDTDATCAVVVLVAAKNEGDPKEAGTGALEDGATGPTELRDCETWRAPFWEVDTDATYTNVEAAAGNNKEGFADAGIEGPENAEVLCVFWGCVVAPNRLRDREPAGVGFWDLGTGVARG